MTVPYNSINFLPLLSRVHSNILAEYIRKLPPGDPVGFPEPDELDRDGLKREIGLMAVMARRTLTLAVTNRISVISDQE